MSNDSGPAIQVPTSHTSYTSHTAHTTSTPPLSHSPTLPLPHSPVLLAEVTRGPAVESRHFGHVVVADTAGKVVFALGDAERPTLPRSAIKAIQALPTVAGGAVERFDLDPGEVAVMCASHAAEPFHLAAV